MRDPARLQAAIEILDAVIASAASGGAAADTLAQRYFAQRRYAGSKDRAAVRELVYAAIRFSAEPPVSGRAALLGLARTRRPELLALFDGSPHAPAAMEADEPQAAPGLVPAWLEPALKARFGDHLEAEAAALIERAPLDLRVNPARASVVDVAQALGAEPIPGIPFGLRLEMPVPLERHPLFLAGAIEIQDAGSQIAVQVAGARPGELVVDLCAGAGGKTLALAADMQGEGRLIASDTDRPRLQAMPARLMRAGIADLVETRLLNPQKEAEQLADIAGTVDLVLVDAPCSGTGTWRRNPELRWRLTPERLERLLGVQARLIDLGASLLKPGGRLVYGVCSVLESEGQAQAQTAADRLGLTLLHAQALSPGSDGCDGFFVAKFERSC